MSSLGEVGRIGMVAYLDSLDLFRRMWRTLLVVGLLFAAGAIAANILESTTGTLIGRTLVSTLCGIGALYFSAPFLVALIHSVIEGRVVQAREFRGTDSARLYFAWGGLLNFAFATLGLVAALIRPETAATALTIEGALFSSIFVVLAWIVAVRTMPLLPGVAVETHGMTLRKALDSTRGHFWFISGAYCLTLLAPALGVAALFGIAVARGTIGVVATVVVSSVVMLALIPLIVVASVVGFAISVRLYQRFAADS